MEHPHKRQKTADGSLTLATDQHPANRPDADRNNVDSANKTPSPQPFIKTGIIPRVDNANQLKMTMVHLQDLRWDSNIVSTHTNAMNKHSGSWVVPSSDIVYFNGGSAQ